MKKVLSMILLLTLLASLVGCAAPASPNTGDKESSSETQAGTTAAEKTEEEATAAESAADGTRAEASDKDLGLVEPGKLHMATNAAFPPYEMPRDDGSFEGIDVDIAAAIAEKLDLELVVSDMDFTSALAAVSSGKADVVLAGLTVTDERRKNMDFSDSYARGIQMAIVAKNSPIRTVDDLKDKMIGTQEGTTGYIYASDTPENGGFGEKNVIAYANGAMAIQALLSGKVDAVIIDNEPAKAFVATNEGLRLLDSKYVEEDYAIGFKKDNKALQDTVNRILRELKDDGTIQKIIGQYIKAE